MWSTREIETNANKEVYVRTTIRELVIYVIFLVVLCFREIQKPTIIHFVPKRNDSISVTFSMTATIKFYYTQILINLFGGFTEVKTVDDFWAFTSGDFLDSLYWEYDNGYGDGSDTGQTEFTCPDGENSVGPCLVTPQDRNILFENKLLGLPR